MYATKSHGLQYPLQGYITIYLLKLLTFADLERLSAAYKELISLSI